MLRLLSVPKSPIIKWISLSVSLRLPTHTARSGSREEGDRVGRDPYPV